MFDDLVVSGKTTQHTHKRWTVVLSAIIQVAIILVFILIPLLVTEALPKESVAAWITAPAPPPPPPPPPPKVQVIKQVAPPLIQQGKLMAPTVIPKKVNIIKEEAPPPDVASGVTGGVAGGIGGGSMGGVLGGIIGSTGGGPPPPPKPTPQRIRVGGNVQQANLIHEVQPIYPEIAKTAHIQGTVLLHAIIAKDGTIQQLQYISGPPLLMRSAMDAVRQWRYRPTMLNGEPVEVETTIQVVFTLGG